MAHPRQGEIRAFRAKQLGCDAHALGVPGTTVVTSTSRLFGRIDVLRHGDASIVTIHPCLAAFVQRAIARLTEPRGIGAAELATGTGEVVLQLLPETEIYYLSPDRFCRTEHAAVRRLTSEDADAFDDFLSRCASTDRAIVEMFLSDALVMGAFVNRELASCASLVFRDSDIADLGVLTRDDYRSHGLARGVVSALCGWCAEHDVILQYEVATWNVASRRLAQSLGLVLFAVEEVAIIPVHPLFGPRV
jgi:RimJ/RimL family protein N-acetyltransferase